MSTVVSADRDTEPAANTVERQEKPAASGRGILGQAALYAILLLGSAIMLLPLIWMVSTASKPIEETIIPEFRLIPGEFLLPENLVKAFQRVPMILYFRNSVIVTAAVTAGRVLLCALAGYSFAKFTYRGRDLLFALVLSTMMIPFYVVVIPLYIVVYQLGWLNNLIALIVPGLVTAFGVFLLRQFMMGVPSELIDAARIDGASEPRTFVTIVLPLTKPALVTLAIFTFMSTWDDYVWPLLVITRQDLLTVPLGLAAFTQEYITYYNELMAAALIGMAPTFLVFLIFQREFVEGVSLSGIKG